TTAAEPRRRVPRTEFQSEFADRLGDKRGDCPRMPKSLGAFAAWSIPIHGFRTFSLDQLGLSYAITVTPHRVGLSRRRPLCLGRMCTMRSNIFESGRRHRPGA